MSDWDDFRRFRSAPKRPPPEHGIRVRTAGTTWWGQRWIEALEHVLGADARRLQRGRSYARAGRAHDLEVQGGVVTASVTGSRPAPYAVRIELSQLDAEQWRAAILAMADKAQFSAELLAGRMPTTIDEAFRAAGTSVFPSRRSDLVTRCSCPDWGDPCKHVAATHYVLGDALDRDPFLLFELRGKAQREVLEALRAARAAGVSAPREGGALPDTPLGSAGSGSDDVPRVSLEPTAADYDRPRAPWPALEFSFEEPRAHGALLRQLGAPPAWRAAESPVASFEGWIRDAARSARRIALADADVEPGAAPGAAPDDDGAAPEAAPDDDGAAPEAAPDDDGAAPEAAPDDDASERARPRATKKRTKKKSATRGKRRAKRRPLSGAGSS